MGFFFFFFFFFSHPFSVLCLGGGCEDELAAGRVWAVDFLCCCGDRGGLPVPTPERRGLAPGSGADYPLGVVVPGPRSIECIWGVWVWVPCPFLCVYMWGEGVNIRLRAWGWEHMLVYMCACRLRLCVRSGLRLRLTHHLSRPPPHHHALPVEDAAVRWWFLAPGQDARASAAHSRRSIGGAWPYWPCWAPIVGWGAFGSPGPGPGPPWCGRLSVEPAGLPPRHPGAPTLWLSGVPPSGSPLPFSGWRPRLSCGGLLGVPCPGGPPDVWARVFSVPASCLAGWGCCSPHTLLNIYMEEPYEHKRAHTHRCTLKHSHWYKNRCSQTHIVLICCCFKTYFVISYVCCSITFNI